LHRLFATIPAWISGKIGERFGSRSGVISVGY